jgi:hypothetical protein
MHSGYTNVAQLLAVMNSLALCRAHRIEKLREAGAPGLGHRQPLLADLHFIGLASRRASMRENCLLIISSTRQELAVQLGRISPGAI